MLCKSLFESIIPSMIFSQSTSVLKKLKSIVQNINFKLEQTLELKVCCLH